MKLLICPVCESCLPNARNDRKYCSFKCSSIFNMGEKRKLNLADNNKSKTCNIYQERKTFKHFSHMKGDKNLPYKDHCQNCGGKMRTENKNRKTWKDYKLNTLWEGIVKRTRVNNWICDLSKEDIKIPDFCPIFGYLFVYKGERSPTVDRIDNSKGYVKGNIIIISRKA